MRNSGSNSRINSRSIPGVTPGVTPGVIPVVTPDEIPGKPGKTPGVTPGVTPGENFPSAKCLGVGRGGFCVIGVGSVSPLVLYPPEGLWGAEPERGPFVFTLHFIGVRRGTGGFKFCAGNPPF